MNNQPQNYYREGINDFQKLVPEVAEKYNDFKKVCFEEVSLSRKKK